MAREITAHGPSEADVRRKIYSEASKYPELKMGEIKIFGPATTTGGGKQYLAKCILS
jgi:hypothetical protein